MNVLKYSQFPAAAQASFTWMGLIMAAAAGCGDAEQEIGFDFYRILIY
ncbi:MAG TPA: hypothetical protein PLG50_08410 [bacterium]|nr:hypothetical protein [bacterium]